MVNRAARNIQADIELNKDLTKYRTLVDARIKEIFEFIAFLKNDYSDNSLDVYPVMLETLIFYQQIKERYFK